MPAPKQAKENTTLGPIGASAGRWSRGQVLPLVDGPRAASGPGQSWQSSAPATSRCAAVPPTPWLAVNSRSGASGPVSRSSSRARVAPRPDVGADLPAVRCLRSSAVQRLHEPGGAQRRGGVGRVPGGEEVQPGRAWAARRRRASVARPRRRSPRRRRRPRVLQVEPPDGVGHAQLVLDVEGHLLRRRPGAAGSTGPCGGRRPRAPSRGGRGSRPCPPRAHLEAPEQVTGLLLPQPEEGVEGLQHRGVEVRRDDDAPADRARSCGSARRRPRSGPRRPAGAVAARDPRRRGGSPRRARATSASASVGVRYSPVSTSMPLSTSRESSPIIPVTLLPSVPGLRRPSCPEIRVVRRRRTLGDGLHCHVTTSSHARTRG